MALFGNGHDVDARKRIASIESDVAQLRRQLADLDADMIRWRKRDTERERRAVKAGSGTDATGDGAPRPRLVAPPGLRGARLRRWQRDHDPEYQTEAQQAANGAEE